MGARLLLSTLIQKLIHVLVAQESLQLQVHLLNQLPNLLAISQDPHLEGQIHIAHPARSASPAAPSSPSTS